MLCILLLFALLAASNCTLIDIIQPLNGAIVDYGDSFLVQVNSTPPDDILVTLFCVGGTNVVEIVASGNTTSMTPNGDQKGTCVLTAAVGPSFVELIMTIVGPTVAGWINLTVPAGSESVVAGNDATVQLFADGGTVQEVSVFLSCPVLLGQSITLESNGTFPFFVPVDFAGSCYFWGIPPADYYVSGTPVLGVYSPLSMTYPGANAVLVGGQDTTVLVSTEAAFPPNITLTLTCQGQSHAQETLAGTPSQFSIPGTFNGLNCVFTTTQPEYFIAIAPRVVTVSLGPEALASILSRYNSASFLSRPVLFSHPNPTA